MRITLLCILFLITHCCHAESLLKNMGIKVGVCNSSLSIRENEGRPFFGYEIEWLIRHSLTGFQAGLYKNYQLSNNFEIQPELFYVRRGVNAATEFLFDTIDYKVKLDYLELPVPVKGNLLISQSIVAGVYAGPYVAVNLAAKRESRIDDVYESLVLENVKRYDYGLVLGLNTNFVIKEKQMIFDLRYNHGLYNIMDPIKSAPRVSEENGWVKNRSWIVLLGIQF